MDDQATIDVTRPTLWRFGDEMQSTEKNAMRRCGLFVGETATKGDVVPSHRETRRRQWQLQQQQLLRRRRRQPQQQLHPRFDRRTAVDPKPTAPEKRRSNLAWPRPKAVVRPPSPDRRRKRQESRDGRSCSSSMSRSRSPPPARRRWCAREKADDHHEDDWACPYCPVRGFDDYDIYMGHRYNCGQKHDKQIAGFVDNFPNRKLYAKDEEKWAYAMLERATRALERREEMWNPSFAFVEDGGSVNMVTSGPRVF